MFSYVIAFNRITLRRKRILSAVVANSIMINGFLDFDLIDGWLISLNDRLGLTKFVKGNFTLHFHYNINNTPCLIWILFDFIFFSLEYYLEVSYTNGKIHIVVQTVQT